MKIQNLLLFALAFATASEAIAALKSNNTADRINNRMVVLQGTPGDGLVHKSFHLDDADEDGTTRVAPPRAWTIEITIDDPFAGSGVPTETLSPLEGISPVVVWVKSDTTGNPALAFVSFGSQGWSRTHLFGSDISGHLDPKWWAASQLSFVHGTPGDINPHVSGTAGDPFVHDQIPDVTIDTTTSDTGQARVPAHAWTIYVDNTILVLPSTAEARDGEPTLGVTWIGDTVVPTVTWAHAVGAGNHDPVIARFVNGAWTAAEAITTSIADDVDPRFAQDATQTIHAVWARDDSEAGTRSVWYASLPNGAGAFSSEERVSRAHESASSPAVATVPSGAVFIAYQSDPNHGSPRVILARRLERQHGHEDFTYRHHVAGRASDEIPASPELASLSDGSLLLTWTASPIRVGFRLYASGAWSAAGYELIGAGESAADARERIKASFTPTSEEPAERDRRRSDGQ